MTTSDTFSDSSTATRRGRKLRELDDTLNKSRSKFWNSPVGRKITNRLPNKPVTSWELMDWVGQTSRLTGSAKLVAFHIAMAYNSKAKSSKISLSVLSVQTGLSRSTVSDAIRTINSIKEWHIVKDFIGPETRQEINFYYPNFSATYARSIATKGGSQK